MKRSRAAWMTAGAVTAAIVVGGVVTARLTGGEVTPRLEAVAATDSESVQSQADQVFESFNGTPAQRDASGVVQAWKLNGAMAECISAAGSPGWDWAGVRDRAPRTDGLGTSVFFKRPTSAAYSTAMMDTAEAIVAENKARTTGPAPEQEKAIDQCLKSESGSSDDAADVAATPLIVRTLRDQWWSMLSGFDAQYGDPRAYEQCFEEVVGADGADALVTGESWPMTLSQILPPAADIAAAAKGEPTARWKEFASIEARWERADWACRADVYNEHLPQITSAIDRFRRDHVEDIAAAQRGWSQTVARAITLGYDPRTGEVTLDGR